MITLGNAAKQLGVSKPTISKAISKGQLSATRREDGSFAIDPAELMRWWEGVRYRFQPQPVYDFQAATPGSNSENTPLLTASADPEVAVRLATLETELAGMKALLEEIRSSRDSWQKQAEQVTLRLPAPEKADGAGTADPIARRSWWRRLAG